MVLITRVNRTRNLALSVVAVALVAGACASDSDSDADSDARGAGSRPNIVFVLVDDLDVESPYLDVMPHVRELIVDRGVDFVNAFATSPVCCPARATLLTGMYPHNDGVLSGTPPDGGYENFVRSGVEQRTVAVRLREAGYRTAFFGKYLNGYEIDPALVPPGWDEWFGLAGNIYPGFGYEANHNGKMESYGSSPDDYQTDVLKDEAISFVEDAEDGDDVPMLLFVWPTPPHAPTKPAPRHAEHELADAELPRRPNFDEEDVSDKPLWIREGRPRLSAAEVEKLTDQYRDGLGALKSVDDLVGELAAALEQAGELESTVFVFSSDNGYNRGSHRLDHKHVPYDESARIPLAVSGPGWESRTETRLVTHLDVVPTMFELAGVRIPGDVDGMSLLPLLDGVRVDEWRTDFLIEFDGTYGVFQTFDTMRDVQRALATGREIPLSPTYRALRSADWLYVEWYAGRDHDYELYDMRADPYQMENLLATSEGRSDRARVVDELHARLEELVVCRGVSCRT